MGSFSTSAPYEVLQVQGPTVLLRELNTSGTGTSVVRLRAGVRYPIFEPFGSGLTAFVTRSGAAAAAVVGALGYRELVGCLLPAGAVSVIASDRVEPFTVRHVAGRYAVLDLARSQRVRTVVTEVGAGERYTIAVLDPASDPFERTESVFVTPTGAAVAGLTTPSPDPRASDTAQIVALSSAGQRTVLDTGKRLEVPPLSLAVEGATASWTHDGKPRSATLE